MRGLLSSTFRHRPNINEKGRRKSKIVTPKGPKAFRRDPNLRCAMKVGYPELDNLGATKSRQGKYEERKEREREKWGVYIGWLVHDQSLGYRFWPPIEKRKKLKALKVVWTLS
jgi:hypothetical protein